MDDDEGYNYDNLPSISSFGHSYCSVYGNLKWHAERDGKPLPTVEKTSKHFQAFLLLGQIDKENNPRENYIPFERFGSCSTISSFILHHQSEISEKYKILCAESLKYTEDHKKDFSQLEQSELTEVFEERINDLYRKLSRS